MISFISMVGYCVTLVCLLFSSGKGSESSHIAAGQDGSFCTTRALLVGLHYVFLSVAYTQHTRNRLGIDVVYSLERLQAAVKIQWEERCWVLVCYFLHQKGILSYRRIRKLHIFDFFLWKWLQCELAFNGRAPLQQCTAMN